MNENPTGPTAEQVKLVRQSYELVVPIADVASDLIYQRIFELAPAARDLFPSDLRAQKHRLMSAIGAAVELLDRPEELAQVLGRLGARHVRYGVVAEHFPIVGEAVLWTLEQGLGEAFTPEVRDAWAAVYGAITDLMLAGMRDAELAAV